MQLMEMYKDAVAIVAKKEGITYVLDSDSQVLYADPNAKDITKEVRTELLRMDKEKSKGVVSERFKVHGLKNLWVLDASVFPNITSGNINAPVMMLANIGSKIIIEDLKKHTQ